MLLHQQTVHAPVNRPWINQITSQHTTNFRLPLLDCINVCVSRNAVGNYASSPLSSRHGSQESLRHLSSMSSMNMLQTPTGNRDIASAQKKKGIKSSLGRFFSKKEKVKATQTSTNIANPLTHEILSFRWRESRTRCRMGRAVLWVDYPWTWVISILTTTRWASAVEWMSQGRPRWTMDDRRRSSLTHSTH